MSRRRTVATKRGNKLTVKIVPGDELDALAEITQQDIEEAKSFAVKYGSPLFRQLLDAE